MTSATLESVGQHRGEAWHEAVKAKVRDFAGAFAARKTLTIGEQLDNGIFTKVPTRVDSLVGAPKTIDDINRISRREALKRGNSELVTEVLNRAAREVRGKAPAAPEPAAHKLGENPRAIVTAIDIWSTYRDANEFQELIQLGAENNRLDTNKISAKQLDLLVEDPTLDVETARELATDERDGIPTGHEKQTAA